MISMMLLRRKRTSSQLLPDSRFIRTLQSPHHVVPDKKTGLYRISTKAFGPSKGDGGLSGDLEQILRSDGLPPLAMYPSLERSVGAAAILVRDIQAAGGRVEHDPVWQNWYHGSVFGVTGAVKKKLLKAAVEIVAIDQHEAARWEREFDNAQSLVSG